MAVTAEQQLHEVLADENVRLGGWLERLFRAEQALKEAAGDYRFPTLDGKISSFELPESENIAIAVTPKRGVTLEEVGVAGGNIQHYANPDTVTNSRPFTGGDTIGAYLCAGYNGAEPDNTVDLSLIVWSGLEGAEIPSQHIATTRLAVVKFIPE